MSASCRKCAAPAEPIEIVRDGVVVLTGALCERCLAEAVDDMALLRQEFEALLAAGISNERANELMIAKINGQGAKA